MIVNGLDERGSLRIILCLRVREWAHKQPRFFVGLFNVIGDCNADVNGVDCSRLLYTGCTDVFTALNLFLILIAGFSMYRQDSQANPSEMVAAVIASTQTLMLLFVRETRDCWIGNANR